MLDLRHYINSLCEPGCSLPHGAWADGHIEPSEFAAAATDEMGRHIDKRDVRQGYYRALRGVMHFTHASGRGASPVTWVEW